MVVGGIILEFEAFPELCRLIMFKAFLILCLVVNLSRTR